MKEKIIRIEETEFVLNKHNSLHDYPAHYEGFIIVTDKQNIRIAQMLTKPYKL